MKPLHRLPGSGAANPARSSPARILPAFFISSLLLFGSGFFTAALADNCGFGERALLPACMTVSVLQDNYGRRIEVDNACGYALVANIDIEGLADEERTFAPGKEKVPIYHQRSVRRVSCCRKHMFPGQCGEVLPGR